MVVSTDRLASEVGVEILRDGGNSVDAAVAVGFALAVVNPEAGNLGGGGFLLHRAASGRVSALDFRSAAPAHAVPQMFAEGAPREPPSVLGHRAAAVPGSVRGLWEAHRRLGRRPWRSLVEPAIRLARGFDVSPRFAASFPPHIVEGLARFEETARIFLPRGSARPPAVGDRFTQADLASTLVGIRDSGADGFYTGETADRIVAGLTRGGGVMGKDDLARYRAAWREPIHFVYRGYEVVCMPPSSSGGVTLAGTANILSAFDLDRLEWQGADHVHLLAEAWRRSYADRNHYLADPDFVAIPVDTLVSEAYGAWRAAGITSRASPSGGVGPGVEDFLRGRDHGPGGSDGTGGSDNSAPRRGADALPREEKQTTHLSVVDAEGSAVSLTTTLNTWYGSKVVPSGTGVLLNNEMDDFTIRPGEPNHFGLVQGSANAIEPGKRMLSAMTPTLVLRGEAGGGEAGRLYLVVGTPGGGTIITTVFQVLSNLVDFGMSLSEAVRAPRVHHQHLPDRIDREPGAVSASVVRDLEARGHEVFERMRPWGDVQAILRHVDGTLEGESDLRRGGAALAP